jgi:hypothetical protein
MREPFGKMRAWLEYHPKGRNFASKNNSDVRRGGGGKDKMKPCSPRRIFCLLFCIKATKRSDLMNSLINKFNDE